MSIYGTYLQESYNKKEAVNEGIISGILTAIGLFIAANLALVGAILLSGAFYEKDRTNILNKIKSNSKSRQLVEKAMKNLAKFFIINLPANLRKYFSPIEKIDFDHYIHAETEKGKGNKRDKETITLNFVNFKASKLFEDIYHKSVRQYIRDTQFPDDYDDKEKDYRIDNTGNYFISVEDELPEFKEKLKPINDAIDKIDSKASSAVKHCVIKINKIAIDDYYLYADFEDAIEMTIKTKDFSNIELTEDEEKELEKIAGVKIK